MGDAVDCVMGDAVCLILLSASQRRIFLCSLRISRLRLAAASALLRRGSPLLLADERFAHFSNATKQFDADQRLLTTAAPIPQKQSTIRMALNRRHNPAVLAGRRVVDVCAMQRRVELGDTRVRGSLDSSSESVQSIGYLLSYLPLV